MLLLCCIRDPRMNLRGVLRSIIKKYSTIINFIRTCIGMNSISKPNHHIVATSCFFSEAVSENTYSPIFPVYSQFIEFSLKCINFSTDLQSVSTLSFYAGTPLSRYFNKDLRIRRWWKIIFRNPQKVRCPPTPEFSPIQKL